MSRHDFAPFGEEIPANQVGRDAHFGPYNDTVNQQFTGKERDSESGLDYFGARYYGSALGRFTSPDPANASANPLDPRSWNAYSYVRNNPLALTDPDGEDYNVCDAQGKNCRSFDDQTWAKFRDANGIQQAGNGALSVTNNNGSETKIESAQYYDPRAGNAVEFLNRATLGLAVNYAGAAAEVGLVEVASGLAKFIPPQVVQNAAKGAVGERVVEAALRLKGYKIVGRHVTVRTAKGIRYVDYVVQKAGETVAIKVKTGDAVRNAGQLAKDASMEAEGGLIASRPNAKTEDVGGQTFLTPGKLKRAVLLELDKRLSSEGFRRSSDKFFGDRYDRWEGEVRQSFTPNLVPRKDRFELDVPLVSVRFEPAEELVAKYEQRPPSFQRTIRAPAPL